MDKLTRLVVLSLLLTACGGDSKATDSETEVSSSTQNPTTAGPETTSTTVDTATTADPTTETVDPTTETTTSETTSESESETTSESDTEMTSESDSETTAGACPVEYTPPACDPIQGAPGIACAMDSECAPGEQCFVVPLLGGTCGECLSDADCPNGGCTIPNPLQGFGAVCNPGAACDGCESDASCNDPENPHCGTIIDAAGILKVLTCGECTSSSDCPDDRPNCATIIEDVTRFSGVLHCVPDCSIPLNESCKIGEDAACESGICSVALAMGIIELGVCGECQDDGDCLGGQTCEAAEADVGEGTLQGSTCM